jgi:hypothetical protein
MQTLVIDTNAIVTRAHLRELEMRMYKFSFVALSAQNALTVSLIQLLK